MKGFITRVDGDKRDVNNSQLSNYMQEIMFMQLEARQASLPGLIQICHIIIRCMYSRVQLLHRDKYYDKSIYHGRMCSPRISSLLDY